MTTTTPFAARVTPMADDMQKIWRAMDELKPSDKAKITKADNKLRSLMAERNRSAQEALHVALDAHCPSRDAKIEEAKAKRDAIIAQAEAEFQAVRKSAQAEAQVFIKPVSDENERVWKENYNLYKQEWLQLVESVVGRQIL